MAIEGTPAEVTGVLTILHTDDFEKQHSELLYFLDDKVNKRKFNLRFQGEPPRNISSGATIKVRGMLQGQNIMFADGSTTSIQTVAPAAATVSGDQNTLVLVTNFTDAAVSCPVTSVQDLMFTDPKLKSIDDLYQEASFGQVSFGGSVASVNINASSTSTCNIGAWADAADAAATAAKINLSAYPRKIYVMPSSNTCGYTGVGQVGGSPSRAWIFRCDMADAYAHELGHNLGMGHASTPTNEYGDVSDVMGYSNMGLRQINSSHKEQMGWLPPEQIEPITYSGNYDIAPLEVDPQLTSYPQILKIAKPDTGEYYYLSYRQPIGFDAGLSASYLNTLTIHRYKGDGLAHNTALLQRLADGGSFTDAVNGVTITQVSHASDRVTVKVQLGTSCQTGTPTVSATPISQSGAPGTTLNYSFAITNMDWNGCPQSTFNLAGTKPSGWSGSLSASSLTLAPGQTGSVTYSVTAPTNATDGSYGIAVQASDTSSSNHANSANATYSVLSAPTGGDTQAPTAPTSLSASVKRTQISLAWSAASDNIGVTGYEVWRNNVKIGTVVSGTSYADSAVTSGSTYTYYVVAFDAAGNLSSPSVAATATFQAATGGGKGKK